MLRPIAPATIAAPAARYAHAIATSAQARWLHTSGVVPIAPDGTTPAALADQAIVVWDNLAAMLAANQMVAADIVSVTTYVVPDQVLGDVMAARDRFMGDHRAASTLVIVAALARPEWLMEVAVIAAKTGDT